VASLVPEDFRALLRGPLRWFYGATLVTSIGIGLSLFLNVIYVHDVRHHSIVFATSLLAANAPISLAASPVIGTLTDLRGLAVVYLTMLVCEVIGLVVWALASSTVLLIVGSVLMALASGSLFGPGSDILTRLVPTGSRQRAFGTNFMLLNLGIGFGGLVSASVVRLSHPATFTWLYLGTAVFIALAGFPIFHVRQFGRPASLDEVADELKVQGWRHVLVDRRLLHFVGAAIVLITCGYGSIDSGLSLFIVNQVHLTVKAVGVALFFNTITIVLAQLFTIKLIEGRSRTLVMGWVSLFWAGAWAMIGAAVHIRHTGALVMVCLAVSVFAVGETLWSPVGPALINDLAPEHLRGRYNAAFGLTWGIASALAPGAPRLAAASGSARFRDVGYRRRRHGTVGFTGIAEGWLDVGAGDSEVRNQ
jgi:MFS family permease